MTTSFTEIHAVAGNPAEMDEFAMSVEICGIGGIHMPDVDVRTVRNEEPFVVVVVLAESVGDQQPHRRLFHLVVDARRIVTDAPYGGCDV